MSAADVYKKLVQLEQEKGVRPKDVENARVRRDIEEVRIAEKQLWTVLSQLKKGQQVALPTIDPLDPQKLGVTFALPSKKQEQEDEAKQQPLTAEQQFAAASQLLHVLLQAFLSEKSDRVLRSVQFQLKTAETQSEVGRLRKSNMLLERLCRELEGKNRKTLEVQQQTDRKYTELRDNMMTQFKGIEESLVKQQESSEAVVGENTTLKEQLKKVLELTKVKDEKAAGEVKAAALEKQILQTQLKIAEGKLAEHTAHNAKLEQQLAVYGEKFQEVEQTMTMSHQNLTQFREQSSLLAKQMQEVTTANKQVKKRNAKLEADNQALQGKVLQVVETSQALTLRLQKAERERDLLKQLTMQYQAIIGKLKQGQASQGKGAEEAPSQPAEENNAQVQ